MNGNRSRIANTRFVPSKKIYESRGDWFLADIQGIDRDRNQLKVAVTKGNYDESIMKLHLATREQE